MVRYQIIDNFLTVDECLQLIEVARPKLEKSGSWSLETASTQYSDYRISEHTYFYTGENDLVRTIESRIEQLSGLPASHGEGIQILRYGVGGHYKVHCDWFDPRYPGNEPVLKVGGQRAATVLMYLNNVPVGGDTYFPKINLRVKPKMGTALFWWNVDEHGTADVMTLHAGEDVIEGEKWIATKWLRERPYLQ